MYRRHGRQLNRFHLNCLRKILHIKWQDKFPDTEVLQRTGFTSIHTLLLKSQARWAGHVVRMEDHRLPKKMLYCELAQGKRNVGCPKKRYKDNLKASLRELHIDTDRWETNAMDRSAWRSSITKGAKAAEILRVSEAERKRAVRKNLPVEPILSSFVCSFCHRSFRAQIGLISHLRTHRMGK